MTQELPELPHVQELAVRLRGGEAPRGRPCPFVVLVSAEVAEGVVEAGHAVNPPAVVGGTSTRVGDVAPVSPTGGIAAASTSSRPGRGPALLSSTRAEPGSSITGSTFTRSWLRSTRAAWSPTKS